MLTVKCPRCGSKRVRHGYAPTPVWRKIFFFRNMLCNSCNWEFKSFSLTSAKTAKSGGRRRRTSKAAYKPAVSGSQIAHDNAGPEASAASDRLESTPVEMKNKLAADEVETSNRIAAIKKKAKVKNRVRVKLHQKI